MAAAIRLSMKHSGLTGTNPSVGTLIVKDGVIVGRGVTEIGGRPHAEAVALAEAGDAAQGATAYVTLEPCAHHGKTPPCANALVTAGISRVVGGAEDPDSRVSGKGYAILEAAGIRVDRGVLADKAADAMAGYLSRSAKKRPEVILKLAVSADGMIGRKGQGQVAITGGIARAQVHLMRAQCDAILVGVGTVVEDDPELTARLEGLSGRSPIRIIIDPSARMPVISKLAMSSRTSPVFAAICAGADPVRRSSLEMVGVRFLPAETMDGHIALPELLDDLAGIGISTILVEGGAATASSFLADDLVDRVLLFQGPENIGADGVKSPLVAEHMPNRFRQIRQADYGRDRFSEWVRA